MIKNRYYKTTSGVDQLSFVANNIAYTTDATQSLFQTNAPEGEIGVYNEDTGALVLGGAVAPVPTNSLVLLLKRGGATESSTPFKINGSTKITKTAYAAPVLHQITITQVTAPTITVGDVWTVVLRETTPANQPFPVWRYSYTVKTGDTATLILAGLRDAINNVLLPQNQGDQLATATSTATTLVITAIQVGRHFSVSRQEAFYAQNYSVAVSQQFSEGSGTYDQVLYYDAESNIKKGVTTNYPINGVPSEYGVPVNDVTTTGNYVTYSIVTIAEEDASKIPVDRHFRKNYQYLFIPTADTTLIAIVDVIFGLVAPA